MPIRACVQCVFRKDDRLLCFEIIDADGGVVGFRSIGGGIEDGETSREAVEREVAEELGVAITEPVLLDVVENIFEFRGQPGHEIVFVYEAQFVDPADYDRAHFEIREPNFETYNAAWKDIDEFRSGRQTLLPRSLLGLLERTPVA
jgi:8-oxo-dGTP pyrophosphatase MutT (NUDIX family)